MRTLRERNDRTAARRSVGPRAVWRVGASALLVAALAACLPAGVRAEEDDVRDAFIVSRKKKPARSRQRAKSAPKAPRTKPAVGERLGLAYSVYRRDANGDWLRADPAADFKAGDAVRFVIEANSDGYLYVFNQTNDDPPRMIFPDGRYNGGDNEVRAHVLYDIPPSRDERSRTWWFRFGGRSGIERLFVLLSRQPLDEVPIRARLAEYCAGRPGGCAWNPPAHVWSGIAGIAADGAVAVGRTDSFGQRQTAEEELAIKRELEATSDDPEPSVVVMNSSASQSTLVAEVSLKHE